MTANFQKELSAQARGGAPLRKELGTPRAPMELVGGISRRKRPGLPPGRQPVCEPSRPTPCAAGVPGTLKRPAREVQGNAPALTPRRARQRYGRFPLRTHPGLTASTRGSRGVATTPSGLTDRADAGRARRRSWCVDAPRMTPTWSGSPADTSRPCRPRSTRSGSDRSFGTGRGSPLALPMPHK